MFGQWVADVDPPARYPGQSWVQTAYTAIILVALPAGTIGIWRQIRPQLTPIPQWIFLSHAVAVIPTCYAVLQLDEQTGFGLCVTLAAILTSAATWGLLTLHTKQKWPFSPQRTTWSGWRVTAVTTSIMLIATAATWSSTRWYVTGRHIDATTTEQAAPSTTPPPNRTDKVAWNTAGDSEQFPQRNKSRLVGDYAVIIERNGIQVRDAITGNERWHYRNDLSDDTEVIGADSTTSTLVVYFSTILGNRQASGFDLRSGKVLWSMELGGFPLVDQNYYTPPAMLTNIFLITNDRNNREIFGYDVNTGYLLWTSQDFANERRALFTRVTSRVGRTQAR